MSRLQFKLVLQSVWVRNSQNGFVIKQKLHFVFTYPTQYGGIGAANHVHIEDAKYSALYSPHQITPQKCAAHLAHVLHF